MTMQFEKSGKRYKTGPVDHAVRIPYKSRPHFHNTLPFNEDICSFLNAVCIYGHDIFNKYRHKTPS